MIDDAPDRDDLIIRYLDGLLTADVFEQLAQMLRNDPEAARQFNDLMLTAQIVRGDCYEHQSPKVSPSAPRDPVVMPTSRRIRWGRLAQAAVLALAAAVWVVFVVSDPDSSSDTTGPQRAATLATLTNLQDATFVSQAPRLGDALTAGTIRLASGRAQIMFDSTAVVDLTGPCDFEIVGPNLGRLTVGSVEAYVPHRAVGFTLDLPKDARVVDLGTRYEVQVDPEGYAQVAVTEGRVQVKDSQTLSPLILQRGQTALLNWSSVSSEALPYVAGLVASDARRTLIVRQPARSKIDRLRSGAGRAADRFTLTQVPPALEGLPTLALPRLGTIHQPAAGYSFTLAQPARVYLLVMNRGPHDLSGWTRTDDAAIWQTSDGKTYTDTIYYRDFDAGLVIVPPNLWHDDFDEYGISHLAVIQPRGLTSGGPLNVQQEN